MMPEFIGTVECIRVGEDAAATTIRDASGTLEHFILWFLPGTAIPLTLTSFTRILHSMWLSLLREARASGQQVIIVHSDSSSVVSAVQLGS